MVAFGKEHPLSGGALTHLVNFLFTDSWNWVPVLAIIRSRSQNTTLREALWRNIQDETGYEKESHLTLCLAFGAGLGVKPSITVEDSGDLFAIINRSEAEQVGYLLAQEALTPEFFRVIRSWVENRPAVDLTYLDEHLEVDIPHIRLLFDATVSLIENSEPFDDILAGIDYGAHVSFGVLDRLYEKARENVPGVGDKQGIKKHKLIIHPPLKVAVIGGGSAGLTFADQALKHEGFEVTLIDRSKVHGSIPEQYQNTRRNSPWQEFIAPLIEREKDGRIPREHEEEYRQIVQRAKESDLLKPLLDAQRFLLKLLRLNNRFSLLNGTAGKIRELPVSQGVLPKYHIDCENIDGDRIELDANVVICAQGASEKALENPYNLIFSQANTLPLRVILSAAYQGNVERAVVIGRAHSAAIATTNLLESGAEVEVWYTEDGNDTRNRGHGIPFRQQQELFVDRITYKINRFSGVREPHYSALRDALRKHSERCRFVNANPYLNAVPPILADLTARYHGWSIVNATGFRPNRIAFIDRYGRESSYREGGLTLYQGSTFVPRSRSAPISNSEWRLPLSLVHIPALGGLEEVAYPSIVPFIFGLGIAYPIPYETGILDTEIEKTIERPGAKIVGVNFALENAKIIIASVQERIRQGV